MKRFVKKVEDFKCEKCGYVNVGSGFTNHCCQCLWSKHVDNNPGDRAQKCGGLMKPIGIQQKGQEFNISHQCQKCGLKKLNKVSPQDNFDAIIAVTVSK